MVEGDTDEDNRAAKRAKLSLWKELVRFSHKKAQHGWAPQPLDTTQSFPEAGTEGEHTAMVLRSC